MLEGVLGILTLKSITNLRFKLSFSKSWLILQFQNMIYGVWKNAVYSKITIPNTHIFAFLIKTRVKSFSTRLFGRFEPKKHVLQKAGATCAFGSAQNATFWKKMRLGPRLITRWECTNLMELRRSIKQKVQCAFVTIRWLFLQLPNYPW